MSSSCIHGPALTAVVVSVIICYNDESEKGIKFVTGRGMRFGDYVRKLRMERQVSLRQFAKACGFQASNYCHVENGTLNSTTEQVQKIAEFFEFQKGSDEYRKLLDLAAEAKKGVPSDLQELIQNNKLIPALLRSVEDENIGPDVLKAIIEDIKSGRYKQAEPGNP